MPNIPHNLLIGTSAEKICKAITIEEGLSAWWTPNAKAKAEVNLLCFCTPPCYTEMYIRNSVARAALD